MPDQPERPVPPVDPGPPDDTTQAHDLPGQTQVTEPQGTPPGEAPGDAPGVSTRPRFTISEAADRCGVSHSTIKRARADGRFPNAYRGAGTGGPGTGPWLIPIEDLWAAGYKVDAPSGPDPVVTQPTPGERPADPGHDDELARVRDQLTEERTRRLVAEALAAERERHLDDMRLAMRALSAGPQPEPGGGPSGETAAPVAAPVEVGHGGAPAVVDPGQARSRPRVRRWVVAVIVAGGGVVAAGVTLVLAGPPPW